MNEKFKAKERNWKNSVFKSCRKERIYELYSHERHHKVIIASRKLGIFFKSQCLRVGDVSMRNMADKYLGI